MVFMGEHHGRSHCCPKKHCCTSEVRKRASGCSTVLLAKYSVDNETTAELFGRNTQHHVWRKNAHPNCKVWWREYHVLELFCCLRAWTACYHRRKNEFPSLSRHFAGECKAICPPIEAQQKLGDATGQQPKRQR